MSKSILPPYGVAFLAIDCQRVFTSLAAQGSKATALLSAKLDEAVPIFRRENIPLFTIYSRASDPRNAGLLEPVKDGIPVAKSHESAFAGSNIDQLLCRARVNTVIAGGVHTTTCVLNTVLGGLSRGYKVIVASDLTAEGDRGRNLCLEEIRRREEKAFKRMSGAGAIIAPAAMLFR